MPISGGELLGSLNASQHQNMLMGMVGSNTNGAAAEALAGGAMSRGMAIGGPMGMLGLGLMGLDPMSLGLRAGMGAWRGGAGLAGAAGMGMAAMAPAAIGLAGMSYAGGQMMQGANQQMGLNGALRQFNFQNNQGGMGFTSNQGFQVGNQLRTMTHEFGPQGEVQTFGELSRLASNMGRMGLAQNVRSVQEFKEKFKEMVSTLKTVAHDMGTSLEEAQKFIVSMKGSGIFNKSDQLRASAGTRIGALAGGLAQSEITGMGSIGSQISRSVGGLGRSGAFAGMAAITNVGIAQRVGAISEEDIYNATGLTGAEGRQAFAASQLQGSASFLRSGRGRKFLASITSGTGNGELDENAISEWMSGGMTTGRTMQLAHQNLKGTGRADFLRNEGRLRGEALKRMNELGVDPATLAYSQWLSSKGYSPDNMDDKSMLAFQRFSGKGRDEADAAIKQIQALPKIMSEARNSTSLMKYNDDLTKKLNTTGIVGLERKIDQIKEGISGTFQKAGASILQAGQESIESWFNQLMGVYEEQATDAASKADAAIRHGDKAAFRQTFGMASMLSKGSSNLLKSAGLGDMTGDASRRGAQAKARSTLSRYQNIAGAANASPGLIAFAKEHSDEIRIASLHAGKGYEGLIDSFDEMTRRNSGKLYEDTDATGAIRSNAEEMLSAHGRSSRLASDKLGRVQAMQDAAGMDRGAAGSMLSRLRADKRGSSSLGTSGNYTVADREKILGGYLSGASSQAPQTLDASAMGGDIMASRSRSLGEEEQRGMARFAMGKDAASMALLSDLYMGDENTSKAARSKLLDIVGDKLDGKEFGKLSDSDRGGVRMAAGMYLTTDPKNAYWMSKLRDGKTLTNGEYQSLANQYGRIVHGRQLTAEEMKQFKSEIGAVARDGATAVAMQSYEELKKAVGMAGARTDYERLRGANVGIALPKTGMDGALTLDITKLDKAVAGSPEAVEAAKLALHAATMTVTEENIGTQYDEQQRAAEKMAGLSLDMKRGLARTGGVVGEAAGMQAMMQQRWKSGGKRWGEAGSVASTLGLNLGDKDMRSLKGKSQQEMLHTLLGQAGLGDDGGVIENKFMGALSEKNEGLRAFKVNQLMGEQGIQEKLEANKVKQAENSDPTFKLLNQHVPKQTDYLKALVASNQEAAQALKDKKDPEATSSQQSGG